MQKNNLISNLTFVLILIAVLIFEYFILNYDFIKAEKEKEAENKVVFNLVHESLKESLLKKEKKIAEQLMKQAEAEQLMKQAEVKKAEEKKKMEEVREKEKLKKEIKDKAEAKEKAEAKKAESEAKEKAEAKKAESEAKEKAEAKKAESEAKEKAEKEAKEKAEKEAEAKEKAESEAKEKAEKEAEAKEKAKKEAEAKEKAEKEAKEKAEKEAEAKEKAEKEAKEKAEKEAREKAEKARLGGLRNGYIKSLREAIERNKTYPLISKTKGEEGTAIISFRITKDGIINNINVNNSTSFGKLDEAAINAIKKVGKFKDIPSDLDDEYLDISVPINFKLGE